LLGSTNPLKGFGDFAFERKSLQLQLEFYIINEESSYTVKEKPALSDIIYIILLSEMNQTNEFL